MHTMLTAAAVRRGGFFTSGDLHEAGVHPREAERAVRAGKLVRLKRSCFAAAEVVRAMDAEERHRLDVLVALHLLVEPAWPSHRSAAVLLGLPLLVRPKVVQLSSGAARPRREPGAPGLRILKSALPASDLAHVPGSTVVATSPARTVLDLARSCALEEGVVVADAALHSKLVTAEQLRLQAVEQRGWPGMVRAAQVLALADRRSESPGESRLRLLLRTLGFSPLPQAWVHGATGERYRVDFLLEGTRVVVEFDGLVKYRGEDAEEVRRAEKARHDDLGNAGYQVVRITWSELSDPALVDRVVRAALRRARAAAGTSTTKAMLT